MKKLFIASLLLCMMGQAMAHSQTGKAEKGCHSHDSKLTHCH
jgi:hypothetical protein